MLEYIAVFLAFFSIYRGINIVFKKHMDFHPKGIMDDAKPKFVKKGSVGVLLIHGFTSSPYEFTDLAQYFTEKGLTVSAPLMKGHGTSPENLATTNDQDWISSMRAGLQELKLNCSHVYIVGTSMGANIALLLAEEAEVRGLVLLAPPLIFRKERFLRATYQIARLLKSFQKKKLNNKILKNVKKRRGYYEKIPLNTIKYVIKMIIKTKKILPNIKVPTLIMQSTNDVWVHEQSVHYIKKHIGSSVVKTVWFDDAYHVLILEKDNEKYSQEMYTFIKEIETSLQPKLEKPIKA